MNKRFVTGFILSALIGLLIIVPQSLAGTVQGNSNLYSIGGGGGGSGGIGAVTYYNLKNTAFDTRNDRYFNKGNKKGNSSGTLRYPKQLLNHIRNRKIAKDETQESKNSRVTNAVLKEGKCVAKVRTANCPLWYNTVSSAPFGGKNTWKHVFALTAERGGQGIEGQLAGFNIRIWRENPQKNRWDIIMERQVGVGNNSTKRIRKLSDSQAITNWWYGGTTLKTRGPANGLGGAYAKRGGIARGMIGNGQRGAANNCKSNMDAKYASNRGRNKNRKFATKRGANRMCYWEGRQMGPNPFNIHTSGVKGIWSQYLPARNKNRVPANEFGPGNRNMDKYLTKKGYKESFRFSWKIPTGSGAKLANWSYSLTTAPGVYYAVQIVGVDTRQGVISQPANTAEAQRFVKCPQKLPSGAPRSCQWFQVYADFPIYTGEKEEVEQEPFSTSEPSVSTELEVESIVQTGEVVDAQVGFSSAVDIDSGKEIESISPERSVLPKSTNLYHYTPQSKYSNIRQGETPKFGVYDSNYAVYKAAGGLITPAIRTVLPADFDPPKTGATAGTINKSAAAKLSQAVNLNIAQANSGGQNANYTISWLRPTLENPCTDLKELKAYPYGGGVVPKWPATPDVCQDLNGSAKVFNAWDDLFWAENKWEAQFIAGKINDYASTDSVGKISNQLLRCNQGPSSNDGIQGNSSFSSNELKAKPARLTSSAQKITFAKAPGGEKTQRAGQLKKTGDGNDIDNCRGRIFGLDNASYISNNQEAQGVVGIKGSGAGGYAHIKLRTNRPDSIGTVKIQRIANPNDIIYIQNVNKTGNSLEINRCKQGLHSTVKLNNGNRDVYVINSSNKAYKVTSAKTGDPGCRGYAAGWTYKPGSKIAKKAKNISNAWVRKHVYWDSTDKIWKAVHNDPQHNNSKLVARGVPKYDASWIARPQGQGTYKSARINPANGGRIPVIGIRPGTNLNSNGAKTNFWSDVWNKDTRRITFRRPGDNKRATARITVYKKTFRTEGSWSVPASARSARGFGSGYSGKRLKGGTYLITFPFSFQSETAAKDYSTLYAVGGVAKNTSWPEAAGSELSANTTGCPKFYNTNLRPATCWGMTASYRGYNNRVLASVNRQTGVPHIPSQFVSVFGPQASR